MNITATLGSPRKQRHVQLIKTRICLIIVILVAQATAACGADRVNQAPDPAKVVIVVVVEREQYVEIRNDTDGPQNLRGWYLSLGRQTTCLLDAEVYLQPGETLRVWALAEDADKDGYNCGLAHPFWSSKQPRRTFLYNADDEVVDEYFGGE